MWTQRIAKLQSQLPPMMQVVAGTVLQADKRTVLIDVGYKSLQRFFRSELADAPIYTPEGRSRGIPAELVVRRTLLTPSLTLALFFLQARREIKP